jgi:hypothetical protein
MAKKNLRERLRRYLERVERRTNLPDAPPVVLRFMASDGEGGPAATGHEQAVLGADGTLGPLEPYELSPAEEAQRRAHVERRKAEETARQMERLDRGTGGTVQ